MRYNFAILLGLGGIMMGCLDGNRETTGPASSDKPDSHPAIAARYGGATNFFKSYSEIQSNWGQAVERFADCGTDQVMTGIGGQVGPYQWSNPAPVFQGVTAYCRSINWDGSLGAQTSVVNGAPGTQSVVYADPNKVVVGVGGSVTNKVLTQVLILQCPWNAATRTVTPSGCSWKGSNGTASGELFFDVHAGVGSSERPKTIATGAGFSTAFQDNVMAIRLTIGSLK